MRFSDFEEYFEQIPGLLMIDMQGRVIYMNLQCASYLEVDRDESIGRKIVDVFPNTKMMESLHVLEKPETIFYNSRIGLGISIHVPLFKNGRKVGLMEFDATQGSEKLYELSEEYSRFLDSELKSLTDPIRTFNGNKYTISNILGDSEVMLNLKKQIISTAKTNSTVLITGETGTGKELVANAIHNLSRRRKEKIIKINAATIPHELVEAELFGYEKGSFTGALKEGKKGKFELADKGTLFIDEIGQMPVGIQAKLLRALQEHEIDKVGGTESIPVDVRIIAATNDNLEELIREGKFRMDLYYRLNVIGIRTPALREHPSDIRLIVQSMLEELNFENGTSITDIDDEAVEFLKQQEWKGNVRELRNVIERATNFSTDNTIHISDLDMRFENSKIDLLALEKSGGDIIRKARDEAERQVIEAAMERYSYNKTKVADFLGIARPLLYQKMKRLNIR